MSSGATARSYTGDMPKLVRARVRVRSYKTAMPKLIRVRVRVRVRFRVSSYTQVTCLS